jgi:cell fate regulator YaaT (PSP1 superfamily)
MAELSETFKKRIKEQRLAMVLLSCQIMLKHSAGKPVTEDQLLLVRLADGSNK